SSHKTPRVRISDTNQFMMVPASNNRCAGFVLVITLIMVALAAIVSVAFLSSTSIERTTANSFSKRARAEMAAQSGLAAALNQLAGTNDFRFITAVGDDGDAAHSKP